MSVEKYDFYIDSFDDAYNVLMQSDTVTHEAVLREIEEQRAIDRKAYDENRGYEEITNIVDHYGAESVSDQYFCLTEFLGYDLRGGINTLRKNPSAAFLPAEDMKYLNRHPAISAAVHSDEHLLLQQKKKIKRTFSLEEGYKREEIVETKPMSCIQVMAKIAEVSLFKKTEKIFVRDRKFPIYPVLSLFICAAVFILPIFLSILNNEIEVANKESDAYIRQLNEEISVLQEELNKKNDFQKIEQIAREECGMIEIELSDTHLMERDDERIVLKEEAEPEQTDIFVALLNALGIRRD